MELLAVLIVMTIVLGLGIWEMTRSNTTFATRVGEEQVVSDTRLCSSRAASAQQDYQMVFRGRVDPANPDDSSSDADTYSYVDGSRQPIEPLPWSSVGGGADPYIPLPSGGAGGAMLCFPLGSDYTYDENGRDSKPMEVMALRFQPIGQVVFLQYWTGTDWETIDQGDVGTVEIIVTGHGEARDSENARNISINMLGDITTSE